MTINLGGPPKSVNECRADDSDYRSFQPKKSMIAQSRDKLGPNFDFG
jgi:hypothetical protein